MSFDEKAHLLSLQRSPFTIVCREFCAHMYRHFDETFFSATGTWDAMLTDWKYSEELQSMLIELGRVYASITPSEKKQISPMIPSVKPLHKDVHSLASVELTEWTENFTPDLDQILDSFVKASVFLHAACWKLDGSKVMIK